MPLPVAAFALCPPLFLRALEKLFLSYIIVYCQLVFWLTWSFQRGVALSALQNQFAEAKVFEPEMAAAGLDCEEAVPDLDRRFADPITSALLDMLTSTDWLLNMLWE